MVGGVGGTVRLGRLQGLKARRCVPPTAAPNRDGFVQCVAGPLVGVAHVVWHAALAVAPEMGCPQDWLELKGRWRMMASS
jgi:hypothetical protein